MRRLTILLAAVGALLLVPAAQAFAENTLKVNVAGSGSGEVSSVGGSEEEFEGEPPIECSGPPATGICEDTMVDVGNGLENLFFNFFHTKGVYLTPTAGPGSEFAGWTPEEGFQHGTFNSCTKSSAQYPSCFANAESEGDAKVTAYFCKEGTALSGEEEVGCEPTGPTNLRTLTLTKEANGPGGVGAVSSKPKGIKCGNACSSAVGSFYENSPVELTVKPVLTASFTKWEGGDCEGVTATTCTVTMNQNEEVKAVFGGSSKTITPAEALTVSKGESTGKGTVKGAGIACEAECDSTVVLYQGPIVEKGKPGKLVALTEAAAPGSKFVSWGGACSGTGACEVTMEEAKEVTADFEALPAETLTVAKEANGPGGVGAVSSKPKGIKCGNTCSSAKATFWEGAKVELTVKPTLTSSFTKWEGGDCEGVTATTCTVTLNSSEEVTAVFGGTSKTITPAEALTLSKEGSGLGTVKAAGLACEVLCSQTTVLYQGPIVEKAKPGKTVALTEAASPGSEFVEWTGACSGSGACEVTMEEAKSVGAVFNELP